MKFTVGLILAGLVAGSTATPARVSSASTPLWLTTLIASPDAAMPTTKLTRAQLKEYLEVAKQGSITTTVSDDTFDALSDLIDRFFEAPKDLTRTEKLMLEAFFADAKTWFDGATNDELGGPRDPAPPRTSAMFAASTAAAAAPAPTGSTPKPAPKVKVPGVHVKPTFSSGVRGSIGYVRLAISGRSKEIIQIRASAGGKDLSRRATMIRDRFREAQNGSGLWWSRLYVTREQGEWVVRSKSYKKVFLVTADANWAKARGMSTQQLANAIMADIRRTMDQ